MLKKKKEEKINLFPEILFENDSEYILKNY